MTLEPRHTYTNQEKYNFYKAAAKRFKAELKLYGATAAIHLENRNDEVFWGKVLHYAYPMGKFRFISASRNISGNITCGCTQCLQYKDFLDEHFWIAIDSDYRYLSQEPEIDAHHYILQTYTYSFENHFCYAPNLQQALLESCHRLVEFNFSEFLTQYSQLVYPLLVWQLYLQGVAEDAFPQSVFHRLLTLPLGASCTKNNGASVLAVLKDRARKLRTHLERQYPEADPTWYEARCNDLGVRRDNCYLFVRGHQLYDLITLLGQRLRQEAVHQDPSLKEKPGFEKCLLNHLMFGQYDEIINLVNDVHLALGI